MPIITPRFALSVDTELMLQLSLIAKEEDVHIQVIFDILISIIRKRHNIFRVIYQRILMRFVV